MSKDGQAAILYLCATPIGNLEDITFRALRILKEADLIAAEDTRHTQKLLNHFNIHTPLTSYHEHNKREKGPQLLEQLQAGKTIALVSDAGMPGVSDPGADMVALCIEAGINVVPVPGPSAVLSALVIAGLPTERFAFYGFLSRENQPRERLLSEIRRQTTTLIFYESPLRVIKTLRLLQEALGNRKAAVARELTKRFEEVVRGTLAELIEYFLNHEPRGEVTLVIAGATEEEIDRERKAALPEPIVHVRQMLAQGENKKAAIKQVAALHNIPKRDVYQMVLDSEQSVENDD
jgi:16S rRNA (cytidine1402-2'-O)-methyltransferase